MLYYCLVDVFWLLDLGHRWSFWTSVVWGRLWWFHVWGWVWDVVFEYLNFLVLYYRGLRIFVDFRRFCIWSVIIFDVLVDLFDVDIILFVLNLLSVIFGHLLCMTRLLLGVKKRTNFRFVAARSITIDSLIFVWMVKALNRRMALIAKKPLRALLPPYFRVRWAWHEFAVFRRILEYLGRSSEVPHMMGINTRLWVMGLLSVRAPAWLVSKHVKGEHL